MLRIEKLQVHGLPPLSFDIPAGDCLAISGPSGSGKSILLRAIADLDFAEGHVMLDGVERCEIPAMNWRRQVRYFAAEPGWWAATPAPHFTKLDCTADMLTSLGLEPGHMTRQIASLSTGERQRLALIRGLEDDPKVLLFDEPTSALDTVAAKQVERLIRQKIEAGAHVLLVSHDQALLERLAHRRLELGTGAEPIEKDANMPSSGEAS